MLSRTESSADPSLVAAYQIRAFIQSKHVGLARKHGWHYESPEMRWRRPVDSKKGPYSSQDNQLREGLVLRQDRYSWPDRIDTKYGTLRILTSGAGYAIEGDDLFNEIKESLGLKQIHEEVLSKEGGSDEEEPTKSEGPRWAITQWKGLPIETAEYAEEDGPLYTSEKVKDAWEEVLTRMGYRREESAASWPACAIV